MNGIVSFSSRKHGNCDSIADFLSNFLPDSDIFRFSDFQIHPCGGCDYQCFADREGCPHFRDMEYRLLDAVCRSDRAIFVVPNYCDYPNANFFIFNERSQCYFQGHPELLEQYLNIPKQFVVVSNSESETFRQAFTQHVSAEPDILFLSAKAFGKSSISRDLITSDEVCNVLKHFISR